MAAAFSATGDMALVRSCYDLRPIYLRHHCYSTRSGTRGARTGAVVRPRQYSRCSADCTRANSAIQPVSQKLCSLLPPGIAARGRGSRHSTSHVIVDRRSKTLKYATYRAPVVHGTSAFVGLFSDHLRATPSYFSDSYSALWRPPPMPQTASIPRALRHLHSSSLMSSLLNMVCGGGRLQRNGYVVQREEDIAPIRCALQAKLHCSLHTGLNDSDVSSMTFGSDVCRMTVGCARVRTPLSDNRSDASSARRAFRGPGDGNGGGDGRGSLMKQMVNITIAGGLAYLLFTGRLGWLFDTILYLWFFILLIPFVGFFAFNWWLEKNLVQGPCPTCGFDCQVIKGLIGEENTSVCPNCGQVFRVEGKTFVREGLRWRDDAENFREGPSSFFSSRKKGEEDDEGVVVDVEVEIFDKD